MKTLVINRRARYDYEIFETYEAGLVLFGHEVKAIKTGKASLKSSFVSLKNSELFLTNAYIAPYQPKNTPKDYDPQRSRKLLLNKHEISSLIGKLKQKGLTLIAIRLYNKKGKIKLNFGLAKGKRKIDKREKIKQREFKRQKERLLKGL
ncbi:MAG: SsrA-binding protein SmpB [bacterium]